MNHTFCRALRPRPTRRQINQEIRCACRLHELFRVEGVLELSRPQPDVVHLRYVQQQIAALQDIISTREMC